MFRVAEKFGCTVRSLIGVAEPGEPLHPVESWFWEAYHDREPAPTAQQIAILISKFSKGQKWQNFMPPGFVDYDKEAQLEAALAEENQRLIGRQLEALRQMYGG